MSDPKVVELTDEQAEAAFSEDDGEAAAALETELGEDEEHDAGVQDEADEAAAASGPPKWCPIPSWMKLPPEGRTVAFVRIPAVWTTTPSGGDRVCILWSITETEERLAYVRARGDSARSLGELAKATIRCIDGHKVDWSQNLKTKGSMAAFWSCIGPKGRQFIRNYYVQTHTLVDTEIVAFFAEHFASMTVQKG